MKHYIYFLLLCLSIPLQAEEVTEPRARAMALTFLRQQYQSRSEALNLQLVYSGNTLESRSSTSHAPFYAYNNTSGKGFVIVSGDDKVQPILGFSTTTNFQVQDMPDNFKAWMNDLCKQINWVRTHRQHQPTKVARAWKKEAPDPIKPIVRHITASWGQGYPFNLDCPIINGQVRGVTGCVMTAAAIVMKYHAWPKQGHGTLEGCTHTGKNNYTIPTRVLGEPYLWDQMPLVYDENSSKESEKQVSRLMADLGLVLHAGYTTSGTVGAIRDIASGLPIYMDYDACAHELRKIDFDRKKWHEILQKELQTNGPIVCGGGSLSTGHAFVLDGYTSNNYYSINWGWGGVFSGYYLLDVSNPDELEEAMFPYQQTVVLGLKKKDAAKDIYDYCMVRNIECKNTRIQKNTPFSVNVSIHRLRTDVSTNFYLSIWLTDKDGKRKEQLSDAIFVNHHKNNEYIQHTAGKEYDRTLTNILCIPESDIRAGDCIRVFYKNESSPDWMPALGNDHVQWYLSIVDDQGSLAHIQGACSMKFHRPTRTLRVDYPKGTEFTLFSLELDRTDVCEKHDTYSIIPLKEFEGLNLILIFRQGGVMQKTYLNIQDD